MTLSSFKSRWISPQSFRRVTASTVWKPTRTSWSNTSVGLLCTQSWRILQGRVGQGGAGRGRVGRAGRGRLGQGGAGRDRAGKRRAAHGGAGRGRCHWSAVRSGCRQQAAGLARQAGSAHKNRGCAACAHQKRAQRVALDHLHADCWALPLAWQKDEVDAGEEPLGVLHLCLPLVGRLLLRRCPAEDLDREGLLALGDACRQGSQARSRKLSRRPAHCCMLASPAKPAAASRQTARPPARPPASPKKTAPEQPAAIR